MRRNFPLGYPTSVLFWPFGKSPDVASKARPVQFAEAAPTFRRPLLNARNPSAHLPI
jgi:hypothetical protein